MGSKMGITKEDFLETVEWMKEEVQPEYSGGMASLRARPASRPRASGYPGGGI